MARRKAPKKMTQDQALIHVEFITALADFKKFWEWQDVNKYEWGRNKTTVVAGVLWSVNPENSDYCGYVPEKKRDAVVSAGWAAAAWHAHEIKLPEQWRRDEE